MNRKLEGLGGDLEFGLNFLHAHWHLTDGMLSFYPDDSRIFLKMIQKSFEKSVLF